MSDLDPTVRARLEEHCAWLLEYQPTLGDQEVAADIRAALAALDAQQPVYDAALAFIADSEDQGGPPHESCNACYWRLRATVKGAPDA